MAFQIFKNTSNKLDEDVINDSYAMYLHKFVDACDDHFEKNKQADCAIMTYDEFKEYYILNILGRSSEFTESIARDFQYLSFDNWSQIAVEIA